MELKNVIKLHQAGFDLYLTKFSIKHLRKLFKDNRIIIARYQHLETETGYQRKIDDPRVKDISEFLEKYINDDLIRSFLPSSIVLNVRDKKGVIWNEKDSSISIRDTAQFFIIDGQHRFFGVLKSKEENYELPVSIICGLNQIQEAAQFLIINTKQKSVRPDLALTVLYNMDPIGTDALVNKLKKALEVEGWKIEATALTIGLNNAQDSPWNNLILRPNEDIREEKKKGRKWIPIKQASFVDSLRLVCAIDGPLKNLSKEQKTHFLLSYWWELKNAYPDAFDFKKGKNYIICKGPGVGVLHSIAPLIYLLTNATGKQVAFFVEKLTKKCKLNKWSKLGEYGKSWGTSQKEFRQHAIELSFILDENLNYLNEREFKKLQRKVGKGLINGNILKKAREILLPLSLRDADMIESDLTNRFGCYALIKFNKKIKTIEGVYIGKSNEIRSRLQQHKDYELYASRPCKDEIETKLLEQMLFHLVKDEFRENEKHPPGTCEICNK